MSFDQTLVVARRLTTARLKPFDQENCLSFVSKLDQEIEPEIRDIIFAWTHGYPLAVNVMVQAIKESKLDPRKEQDQRQILAIMSEQVINRGVFSSIVQEPDDLVWCQTMLSLFSVPRRCNLSIMQKMVERFAHPYRLGSSLAYMSLPKRINQTTDVLNWNPAKAGFSVEAPIRHMFLVKMKLEESATFTAIHRFLAITNRQLVDEVSGTDRVRYWLEYLYHCAHCEEGTLLLQIVEKTMRQIVAEPVEYLLQFHEDFVSDEELKTVLDVHSNMILSLIYRQFAIINKQSAMEAKETERVFYLQEFFYYVILDPVIIDLSLFLKETVQQIVKEESAHICFKLYEALLRDTRIKEKLGESIVVFSSLLGASSQGG